LEIYTYHCQVYTLRIRLLVRKQEAKLSLG